MTSKELKKIIDDSTKSLKKEITKGLDSLGALTSASNDSMKQIRDEIDKTKNFLDKKKDEASEKELVDQGFLKNKRGVWMTPKDDNGKRVTAKKEVVAELKEKSLDLHKPKISIQEAFDTLSGSTINVLDQFEKFALIPGLPEEFSNGILNASSSIKEVIGVTEQVFPIISEMKSVLAALSSPIGIIVVLIAAVVGALVYLWETNESFRESVMGAWEGIKETLSIIWDTVLEPIFTSMKEMLLSIWENAILPLWEKWSEFVGAIALLLIEIWEGVLKPAVDWFIETFGPILAEIVDEVSKAFSIAFEAVGAILGLFLDIAKNIINALTEVFKGLVNFFKGVFTGDFDLAMQGVKQILDGLFGDSTQIIEGLKEIFTGIVNFVKGVFTGDWKMAWEGVKGIFSGIVNTFFGIFSSVWDKILGLFGKGKEIFLGLTEGIVSVFVNIVNAILKGINKAIAVPFNLLNGILNFVRAINIVGIKPFIGLWKENPITAPQIPMIPAYKRGTNFVPMTGLALLHKGETVIPADQGDPYQAMDDDETLSLLMEINSHLMNIASKDQDVYLDSDKIGKIQDNITKRRNKALGYG